MQESERSSYVLSSETGHTPIAAVIIGVMGYLDVNNELSVADPLYPLLFVHQLIAARAKLLFV